MATGFRGCLKTGSFSCLGCLVVVLGVFFVVGAIGLTMGVPDPENVTRELSRDLPSGAVPVAPRPAEVPGAPEIERMPPSPGGAPPTPGRVVLDLSMGEFKIEPGPPGQPIRVEADFDEASYELVESLEQEDGVWTYRLEFGSSIAWMRRMFKPGEVNNRVKVILPRGVPFALEGDLGIGQTRVELGGLWVTDVDLDVGIGEHQVSFSEPVPQPMERFRLRGSTGELSIVGLGNASPATAQAHQNIGEFRLDLSGQWRQDSQVKASLRIGELRIRAPDENVKFDTTRTSLTLGEKNLAGAGNRAPPPPGAPEVSLWATSFLGELAVSR